MGEIPLGGVPYVYSPPSSPAPDSPPAEPAEPPQEPAATPGFRLQMLADAPVDDDLTDRFGYGDLADGLAQLIEGEATATPLTIAVSAPWGAGKTSLMKLVENRIVRQRVQRGEAPAIVVWFNAWMHDAAPSLSAALAADVARHATRCRDPLTRLWHPLPTSMLSPQERTRRKAWLGAVALVLAVGIYFLAHRLIGPSLTAAARVQAALGASVAGWLAVAAGLTFLWPRVHRSVAAVAAFVDDPRSAAATGSMPDVAAQLGELIGEAREGFSRAWRARETPRFVVVVEDLERCQLPRAVDVCEVVAQLLGHPGVITVLVGDLRVIAASAEVKYREAAGCFGQDPGFAADGLGRFFLQKVVQFELELPPVPYWRLQALARSAPPTASIDGFMANRRFPAPLRRPPVRLPRLPTFDGGAAVLRRDAGRLIDGAISDVLAGSEAARDSAEVEQEVLRRLMAAVESRYTMSMSQQQIARMTTWMTPPEEVRRRLQLRATADAEIRTRAEAAILELLPPLPRMAKRLLNRLSFLLVVAWNRNLIGDLVTPEQLGKWAVLLDQWPTAARAITRNPALAWELEKLAAEPEDAFAVKCTACTPPLARDVPGLRKFFSTDPPIGEVAEHLVYLGANVRPPAPADQ